LFHDIIPLDISDVNVGAIALPWEDRLAPFLLRVELAIKLTKIRPEPITAMGPGSVVARALSDDFSVAPTLSGSKHRDIIRVFMNGSFDVYEGRGRR
jgi:hypothetical protein